MKKILYTLLYSIFSIMVNAQESGSVFQFLNLPISSHASALGGENISVIEDDITLALHNPALLGSVTDRTIGLNYMSYIAGSKLASAMYSQENGDRGNWAVSAQYLDYGEFSERNEYDESIGTFKCKDMMFGFTYSYFFYDCLVGGATGKLIYSHYDKNSSFGVGVDLGLNYFNEDKDFSTSLVIKNIGGQLKAFEDTRESFPADVQLGLTKRMAHAPFRISATLIHLNRWKDSYFYTTDNSKFNFGKKLIRHLVIGSDIILSDQIYASIGYNFFRGKELKEEGGSSWTGASLGAGVQLSRINLGVSYANYHIGASSLLFNFGLKL